MVNIDYVALCSLASWDRELAFDGGLAHRDRLRSFNLDYSWDSLARIDAFLDELRVQHAPGFDDFLEHAANQNLLYLLAFYVGEVRARSVGRPSKWVSWDELLQIDAGMRMFGAGFHSSVAQVSPGLFLPLVSICSRLFDGPDDKSVAFSAGMELDPPPTLARLTGRTPLAPVAAQSLVPDYPAAFAALPGRRREQYLNLMFPDWPADIVQTMQAALPVLLSEGRVVWAAILMANRALHDGSAVAAPAELVYDPRGMAEPDVLRVVAKMLVGLHGQRHEDPYLQRYADHLAGESTPLLGWQTPPQLSPYPLRTATLQLDAQALPGRRLLLGTFPVLVSDRYPGIVTVAPREVWPADLVQQWEAELAPAAPASPDPTGEEQDAEALYVDGLHLWHGTYNNGRRAIGYAFDKWEQAAARGHYLALCAVAFFARHRAGGPLDDEPVNEILAAKGERAAARARQIAEQELGLVQAAKLHFREDRPYPRDAVEEAKRLLAAAAAGGDQHAANMLAVLSRKR